MSIRLIVVGAGGSGREVYTWIEQSPSYREAYNVSDVVFLDDSPSELDRGPVISTVREYQPHEYDRCVVAIGNPAVRRRVTKQLEAKGALFATFVDDRALVGSNVHIGYGSVICPRVTLTTNICVGDHVQINVGTSVFHDSSIGDFVTLSPHVNVMGGVEIANDVFVGGSACILPRLALGNNSIIGAGAVVTKSVVPQAVAVGNPARQR